MKPDQISWTERNQENSKHVNKSYQVNQQIIGPQYDSHLKVGASTPALSFIGAPTTGDEVVGSWRLECRPQGSYKRVIKLTTSRMHTEIKHVGEHKEKRESTITNILRGQEDPCSISVHVFVVKAPQLLLS